MVAATNLISENAVAADGLNGRVPAVISYRGGFAILPWLRSPHR